MMDSLWLLDSLDCFERRCLCKRLFLDNGSIRTCLKGTVSRGSHGMGHGHMREACTKQPTGSLR